MSRKDYERIAGALAQARLMESYNGQDSAAAVDTATKIIADALAEDNPRFDRARFLRAANA